MDTRILILDGDGSSRQAHVSSLAAAGYHCEAVPSAAEALPVLAKDDVALVLCDAALADGSGLEFLTNVRVNRPGVPLVVTAAEGSLAESILALRLGACDYLLKPIPTATLVETCRRILQERDSLIEANRYRRAASRAEIPHELVGTSRAIREVGRLIESASTSHTTILLTGESGTGKEVVARAIHRATTSRGGPFVAINCAALPETLLESELFGHRKGAFTGAHADKQGYFEAARKGTLFLDEIGELPLALQPKLLRAIERKEIVPVGDTRATSVEVRLIAATNRDLKRECAERKFREDLYYRLHVLVIPLPPLRERREDIPLLVDHFVSRLNRDMKKSCLGLGRDALGAALAYDWPGNVRELENAIERAMLVSSSQYLTAADLGLSVGIPEPEGDASDDLKANVARFEAEHIRRVLLHAQGNRERAAHRLGISPSTLYRKMNELGLHDGISHPTATLMPAMRGA